MFIELAPDCTDVPPPHPLSSTPKIKNQPRTSNLYRRGSPSLLEQQGLDDNRHDIGELDDSADVNIIKPLELHAIDRDDIRRRCDFITDYSAEAHPDVPVD